MVDDGYLIGYEDGSGNFVEVGRFNNKAEDTSKPIQIKHANSGETIELDSSGLNAESVNANTASIGPQNVNPILTESDFSSISTHSGDRISPSSTTGDIFDLASPVTTISGAVYGNGLQRLRFTFDSNNTETYYADTVALAADNNGDNMAVIDVPTVSDVSKLEWEIDSTSGTKVIGYKVTTL